VAVIAKKCPSDSSLITHGVSGRIDYYSLEVLAKKCWSNFLNNSKKCFFETNWEREGEAPKGWGEGLKGST